MNKFEIVGRARRTSLISTFGVGSLYPAESDSVMICGLDEWPRYGPVVREPRLEASLGVQEFRLPSAGRKQGDIPVVRFPNWAFCPKCRQLDKFWKLTDRKSRTCTRCNIGTITPSRFVACCPNGHIEDFPYDLWVHGIYPAGNDHALTLVTKGQSSALIDLEVACTCGQRRSLDGAFDVDAFRGLKRCGGKTPWLPSKVSTSDQCEQPLRTLQRGSSNVWFASTRSAISIPSVRERARKFIEPKVKGLDADVDVRLIAGSYAPPSGLTKEDVIQAALELTTPAASRPRPTDTELRAEEYRALVNGLRDGQDGSDQFVCTEVDLTGAQLPGVIEQVSRVPRLREVRALAGFSRVRPAALPDSPASRSPLAPLSATPMSWLPGIEVLGEGVFFRLNNAALTAWCEGAFAASRVRQILASQETVSSASFASHFEVAARSLVLHSLAHVILDECSLTAGYPTASLRERVYDSDDQAGILIYTATADSAGSLGGLAALSDRDRFSGLFASAMKRAAWCTSDPVCIESGPTGIDGMNLCACHACLLLPETSCERFNVVLDRRCLVGPGSLFESEATL